MSWIEIVPYAKSTGQLRAAYDRVKSPGGAIDNIMQIHSLRPHTLLGHMSLYKSVLHHTANRLPAWLLETVGIYVSMLNKCSYCVDHHLAGLRRLLSDDVRSDAIQRALEQGDLTACFNAREQAVLAYARRLTEAPAKVSKADAQALRTAGLTDGELLEVNQVVSYFAYANRTILGLGVTTRGDVLGLSPGDSDDASDWQHG
ncbi:MAG: peroxidase-related enzyme [Candidatus Neomarinimicrobiota bacterium]